MKTETPHETAERKPQKRLKAALLTAAWSLPAGIKCDCPCLLLGAAYCAPACYHRSGEGSCLKCDGSGVTMENAFRFAQESLARELRESLLTTRDRLAAEGRGHKEANIKHSYSMSIAGVNDAVEAFDACCKELGFEVKTNADLRD